jgi:hypothetical protein
MGLITKLPTNLKSALINLAAATSGNNEIVAAVSGEVVRLHALLITCASAVDVIIQTGAGGDNLIVFRNVTSISLDLRGHDLEWCANTAGDNLNFNISGAVNVGGRIWYTQG